MSRNNIWKMYLVSFLYGGHFFGAVLVPMLTEWGGLTFTQAMTLQSIFMGANTIFQIPTGVIADKWGRKTSICVGFLISILGFVIYTLQPSFVIFALAEIALALGMSLVSGADSALIYDTLAESGETTKAGRVSGTFSVLHMVGLMLATPIGSFLAGYYDLIAPMKFTVIPMTLAFIVAFTMKEPEYVHKSKRRISIRGQLLSGISLLRKDQVLRQLTLDFSIVRVAGMAMIWLYQPMLQEIGLPISVFGMVSSIFVACEILIMLDVDRVNRITKSRENTFRMGRILPLIGYVLCVFALSINSPTQSHWLALGGIITTIAFSLSRQPFFEAPINERIDSNERATVNSTVRMLSSALMICVNPVIGWTADQSLLIPLISFCVMLLCWSVYKHFKN